jgi:septal ring factor EnvC (AmiA/AmiB activator)
MIFGKEIIAVATVALLGVGTYAWYIEGKLDKAQKEIGGLTQENKELAQKLSDSVLAEKQLRSEMELWRSLYAEIQGEFDGIREQRDQMSKRLASLQENEDVQAFVECPMPDSLYDWVRQN